MDAPSLLQGTYGSPGRPLPFLRIIIIIIILNLGNRMYYKFIFIKINCTLLG